MKKKAEGMGLRETFAIHRRAARDMRRAAPAVSYTHLDVYKRQVR